MGTLALMMDDSPVVMVSSEKANSANGIPELSSPTNMTGSHRLRSRPNWPRQNRNGNKNRAPMVTRKVAVGIGPNSVTARRMNKRRNPRSHPVPRTAGPRQTLRADPLISKNALEMKQGLLAWQAASVARQPPLRPITRWQGTMMDSRFRPTAPPMARAA